MSYWMFNPCSPCCTEGCSLPAGDVNVLVSNAASDYIKFTAPNVNNTWTFDIPLSGLWNDIYNTDHIRSYLLTYCTGQWDSWAVKFCTDKNASCTVRLYLSGTTTGLINRSGFMCGPMMHYKHTILNDGLCYSGSMCQEYLEKPTKAYAYNFSSSGITRSASGLPSFLSNSDPTVPCNNQCFQNTSVLSFNGDRYNCYPGNFMYGGSITKNRVTETCRTYIPCNNPGLGNISVAKGDGQSIESLSTFGGVFGVNFYDDSKSTTAKYQDNLNNICDIPEKIYLETHVFPYSGICAGAFCTNTSGIGNVKMGIEIQDICELNYSSDLGYWVGSGLNYYLHSRICGTDNPSGWYYGLMSGVKGNTTIKTNCGSSCDSLESGTFSVKIIPAFSNFVQTSGFGCTNKSMNFPIVYYNDKITLISNLFGVANSTCSPFYLESSPQRFSTNMVFHDATPSDIDGNFLNDLQVQYPSMYNNLISGGILTDKISRRTYFKSANPWVILQGFPASGPVVQFDMKDIFPYMGSHGFGLSSFSETTFPFQTTGFLRNYDCLAGTGFFILSE